MARRRMISQDMISDPHFNSLSLEAQNVFVRMLAVSDDCGVVPANAYRLAVLVNPPKKIAGKLDRILGEISAGGLGSIFEYEGEQYFAFKLKSFQEYQSYILKKATKSEYLRIPREAFEELSKNFQEIPRNSGRNDSSALSTVESNKQKVEGNKQKEESKETWRASETDFDLLWKDYPRPEGRKDALRHFFASVKTALDLSDLRVALDNYRRVANERDPQYVKLGSTWFNNWRDWVNPTASMMAKSLTKEESLEEYYAKQRVRLAAKGAAHG